MKRKLHKMIALLAILFVPFLLSAQDYGCNLEESFENGIPEGWIQECISGEVQWVKETGGSFPKGAFDGDARLKFTANSNVTTNVVTRLITPNLCKVNGDGKISFSKLADPILVFAHAQDKWTNDFDVLRVLYRTKEGGAWGKLIEYNKYISRWTLDTLSLASVSGAEFLQLAFEAEDRLGRGVVLDKIEVRSAPSCFAPSEMSARDLSNDTAVITWAGAYDVESYSLKVSTTLLTPEQLANDNYIADVDNQVLRRVSKYVLRGLQTNKKYYYYLRSNCYTEYSEWVVDSFTTVNYIDLPYFTDFDFPKTPGHPTRQDTWYYGSAEDAYPPYINTGREDSYIGYYSVNKDYALCFYGDHFFKGMTLFSSSENHYIPANSYSYAVMPKLRDTVNIQNLYLSFWGMNYNADNFDIIVGLIEDPTDINGFEPVDTVGTRYNQTKEEFFVSFEKYKGDGRYIAFMSKFPYRNTFVLDSLTVDYRPKFMKVSDFSMGIPTSTSVKFDFNESYATYEVVLSKTALQEDFIATATDVIRKKISNHGIVDNLENETEYCVYVRACDDSDAGAWSRVRYVRTPGKVTGLPYSFAEGLDALNSTASTLYTYQQRFGDVRNTYYPKAALSLISHYSGSMPISISSSYGDKASGDVLTPAPTRYVYRYWLNNNALTGYYTAMILPEIQVGFDTTRISFFIANPEDDSRYNYSHTIVGFMSDANDISTFHPIDTIELNEGVSKYVYYDLNNYKGEGKFFAIYASGDDVKGKASANMFYVDEIKFSKIPVCETPTNINIVANPTNPTEVTFSWDANGVNTWVFRLFEKKYTTDEMYEEASNKLEYVYNDTLTTNSITIKDLKAPKHTYYYSIRSLCGASAGEWTFVADYITECKAFEYLPFKETFEDYAADADGKIKGFTAPCLYTQQHRYQDPNNGTYFYSPYISSKSFDGGVTYNKSFLFYNQTYSKTGGKRQYLALPKMEKSIKELQVTFDVYSAKLDYSVEIGAMTDPNDTTTLQVIKVIPMKNEPNNQWNRVIATLESYNGSGEHLAFRIVEKEKTVTLYYLDNILVEEIQKCARPEKVKIDDISYNKASLSWDSPKDNTMWAVLLAKEKLTDEQLSDLKSASTLIYRTDTVTKNPCTIENLVGNTSYFIYVRALCDDEVGAWSSVVTLRTNCQPLAPENMTIEKFDIYTNGDVPDCYVVGNNTSMANPTYIPSCSRSYKYSGLTSLKIESLVDQQIYNGAYFVSPYLDVQDIKTVRLQFWGAAPTTDYASDKYAHSIIVGVVTNPFNLATFEVIDTLVFGMEWRPYDVTFEKYTTDYLGQKGKYIMLLSDFPKSNCVFIDDLSFGIVPECHTSVSVNNITDKSFDLSLTGTAPYQVKVSKTLLSGETMDAVSSVDVQSSTYNVNNLKPNTEYYVYARSTCKDKSWSEWSTVRVVRTTCSSKITLPYSENFNGNIAPSSLKTGVAPQCWNGYYTANDASYPTTINYTTPMAVLEATNATDRSYLVTEEIDTDSLGDCMITLYAVAKGNSSATYNYTPELVVGIVEDITNIAGSFVPCDTVLCATGNPVKKEIYFTNYKGRGKYVAIVPNYDATVKKKSLIYIDDILIEKIPSCPRPYDFSFVSNTDVSLTFSFVHQGGTKYEFKCGPVGFDPMEDAGIVTEFTGKVGEAKGLAPATEYDVYIRAFCNDTDASPWTFVDTRSTLKDIYRNFPYNCNFENEEEVSAWTFVQDNQTDKWYIGVDAAYEVSETKNKDDKALYISYDGGNSMQYFNLFEKGQKDETLMPQSYSWAYRTIYLEPGVYDLSYTWTCTGFASPKEPDFPSDYMKVLLIPATATFSAGSNMVMAANGKYEVRFDAAPSECIDLSPGRKVMFCALNDAWTTTEVEVTVTEDIAGMYNLVCFWLNEDRGEGETTIRSGAIDDISIVPQTCLAPLNFALTQYNNESADFKWTALEKDGEFIVRVTDNLKASVDSLTEFVFEDTVKSSSIHVTGLVEKTTYKAYVSTFCGEGNASYWIDPIQFTTSCNPFKTDTVYSYDDANSISDCYVIGHKSTGTKYVKPRLAMNSTQIWDRTAEPSKSYAIRFDQGSSVTNTNGYAGGYLALPLFEGDMDSLYVTFWMRCVYHNSPSGTVTNTYLGTDYARKITVGTMTDPNDYRTFKALQVIEYPYTQADIPTGTTIADDPTGCAYWVKYSVPLKDAEGLFIAFKNDQYGFKRNIVFIDDIEITARRCSAPINMNMTDVKMNSATLNVEDKAGQYVVEIADNEQFVRAIADTISTFPYKFENLKESQEYYVRVKTICGPFEESEWSIPVVFTTLRGVLYHESFEQLTLYPKDWNRAGAPKLTEVLGVVNPRFAYTQPTEAFGWTSKEPLNESGMFSNLNMVAPFTGTNTYWFFSPALDLTDETAKYHMSFELALTDYGNNAPVAAQAKADVNNKFAILVSEDGGLTWKSANATVWDWNTCLNIPYDGKEYSLDLTKYAGKAIKVAFCVEAAQAVGKADLHLDNVHINVYQEEVVVEPICETVDYEGPNFVVVSDEMVVGENKFEKWVLAKAKGESDVLHKLSLNVIPMKETRLAPAYMCERDVYSDVENQFMNLEKPGTYKRKLNSANGCDSIVILELNVKPTLRTVVYDTICQGMKLSWNDKEYYMTGVYIDTLTASTGCDSIVTLNLKVNDAIRRTEYVNICYGESYEFFGKTITESGSYEHLVKTPGDCDSLITLVATVLPDYSNIVIPVVIAEGETYNGNGFVGLTQPGSYRLPLKSKVGGCDSIITLNLVVGNATDYEELNLCFGGSYKFGSQTITEAGQYIEKFAEDSVVLLNVTQLPDFRQTIDTIICKGEVYNEYGFDNLTATGQYIKEYTSVDGCDSTITLNLTVINGETTYVTDTITTDELPYEYMDLYYDIATAPGVHEEIIEIKAENCEDIIVHTLVVLLADDVENVEVSDLVLVPNPIKANNTLYVEAEFTVNERRDMLVEVFNAVGQRVIVDAPTVYPVAIDGLSERGVYVVRIITGEGTVYQGKVVVQ